MADGQGDINRSNTGTVPKIKYSNNAMANRPPKDQSKSLRMSHNLSPSWHMYDDPPNFIHNKGRNQRNRYLAMDVATENCEVHNGLANGITPVSSSSTSRRNSVGSTLKCDNVTKYPDRKQIEDKLSQIREYLEVTSNLMTSIRNSDEQIFDIDEKTNLLQTRNDLLDSENKLSKLLEEIDKSEMADSQAVQNLTNGDNNSDLSGDFIKRTEADFESIENELTSLQDQQQSLLNLKQKSENRLMEARQIQLRLASNASSTNRINSDDRKSNKDLSLAEYDSAIQELEERTKRLNRDKPNGEKFNSDKILSEMHHLQSQIVSMHDANNEREQLIQVLDNRDMELRSQQAELKKKLLELQNKKDQVDQLVMQLQIMDEDTQNDVGAQVRNIVTMKDQLNKLKGMLEIVNNTTEQASPAEVQAAANEICLTAENLQNEISKPSHKQNDSYVENRLRDNHVLNETCQKTLNKSQQNQRGAKPKQRTSSINEKIALVSELEAKKRELEEIMGKHKAATSNLNHDVTGNRVNDTSWKPPIFCQDHGSDDRVSSEGDEDEFQEIPYGDPTIFPGQLNSYFASNRSKQQIYDNRSECGAHGDGLVTLPGTSERNLRSLSVNASDYSGTRLTRNNENQEKRDDLQKQLELIKSVCDSVLEQIPDNRQPSNIQQVRNNITPPSVYSEQQRVSCPSSPFRPNHQNQIAMQSVAEMPWTQGQNHQLDMGNNYQNWLATNSLQTQSFMLNTLNQCCQMLWMQQRELAQLKNTVNMLQERLEVPQYAQSGNLSSIFHPPSYNQASSQNHVPNNHLRVPSSQKTNQVSAACSMPNLNQYNTVSSNNDLAFTNASTAAPNSAILESCLNNVSQHNLLHAVNSSNINHRHHQAIPAQIWNGQALNNQVPPGNRANNYWDNFRSYSRQNQLSSKNSESSIHNTASSHGITVGDTVAHSSRYHLDRVNPFPIMTTSKTNSENSSTNSRETTPRRRHFKVSAQNFENLKSDQHGMPPPDVLNVNQNFCKSSFDQQEHNSSQQEVDFDSDDFEIDLDRPLTINPPRSNLSLVGSIVNESSEDSQDRQRRQKKNKLVDELRENVYKEVASLISANEARPHFLIQLFKDLQKIESDSLRLKILQSVQNILTQSMNCPIAINSKLLRDSDSTLSESVEQTLNWSKPTKQYSSEILNMHLEGDEPFLRNSYKEVVALLEASNDDIIGNHLLANIKQIFLESEFLKDSVKDTVFVKHFSNVFNDVLEQYRGKKVYDVKRHLIQTMGDLLHGELSFIHLIQETLPENYVVQERKDSVHSNMAFNVTNTLFNIPNQSLLLQNDNIQNDDLAEADQSRLGESETEDEGAVGGILESPGEPQILSQEHSEEVLNVPTIDFPPNGEGLDQVPTRLPTKIKSGTNTPTNGNCQGRL
ncbi:hypothetical protein ABEB36_006034 [Hypothenemus hampei]|uniref:Pericentriolar material 1 protein C-terminal domain-containing protein n=1 Tax=Hypothenemus hampei TaxID=57062 RepID=A0ABD1F091_HYPHA